jgi:hypothetical protein
MLTPDLDPAGLVTPTAVPVCGWDVFLMSGRGCGANLQTDAFGYALEHL